jgi:hypothetical protein
MAPEGCPSSRNQALKFTRISRASDRGRITKVNEGESKLSKAPDIRTFFQVIEKAMENTAL